MGDTFEDVVDYALGMALNIFTEMVKEQKNYTEILNYDSIKEQTYDKVSEDINNDPRFENFNVEKVLDRVESYIFDGGLLADWAIY